MQRRHVCSFYLGLHVRKGFVLMEVGEACVKENLSFFIKKFGFTDVTVCMWKCYYVSHINSLFKCSVVVKNKVTEDQKKKYCTVSYLYKLILVSLHLKLLSIIV